MARRTARKAARGAVPMDGASIRNEVAAIALVAFALLSLIALFTTEGAVLSWWHETLFAFLGWGALLVPFVMAALAAEMWFGLMRRSMAAPVGGGVIAFAALLAVLQHFQRGEPARGEGAGGYLGAALANIASGALGEVGAPIALIALFLVGVVLAANRTLAQLAAPAWDRRGAVTGLRPGVMLPGGTATKFAGAATIEDDADADGDVAMGREPAQPMRINLPPERPKSAARAPEPGQKPPLRLLPPDQASAVGEPSIDGLAQAAVAAEGVLHAKADRVWLLPSLDLLAAGDHGKAGGPSEIKRNAGIIEETLSHFGITATVVEATVGPVVTRYELKPA